MRSKWDVPQRQISPCFLEHAHRFWHSKQLYLVQQKYRDLVAYLFGVLIL